MGTWCSVQRSDPPPRHCEKLVFTSKTWDAKSDAWKSGLSSRGNASSRAILLPPHSQGRTPLSRGHEQRDKSASMPFGVDASLCLTPHTTGRRVLAPSLHQLSVDGMPDHSNESRELQPQYGPNRHLAFSPWCGTVRAEVVNYMKDVLFDPTDNALQYAEAKTSISVDTNIDGTALPYPRCASPTNFSMPEGSFSKPLVSAYQLGRRTPSTSSARSGSSPRSPCYFPQLRLIHRSGPLETVQEGDEKT